MSSLPHSEFKSAWITSDCPKKMGAGHSVLSLSDHKSVAIIYHHLSIYLYVLYVSLENSHIPIAKMSTLGMGLHYTNMQFGEWDKSVGKGACHQIWEPKFQSIHHMVEE